MKYRIDFTPIHPVNTETAWYSLKRLEAQIPLAEDRVFRQNALLKRDAVSKEA